jgi:peptidoglycan-associated lipoprotein
MKLRHAATLLLVPMALGACRKKPPADPGPQRDTTSVAVSGRDAAREDSIRRAQAAADQAERDRIERERRAREAAASGAREMLTEIIYFDYDSDEIGATAEEKLNAKAAVLRANPTVRLRFEGHCDQRGSTEYNLALGQRRAESVRAYLVNLGIDGSRLSTISYGKEKPLVEGDDESAFQKNRRAEFDVIGGTVDTVPPGMSR